MARRADAFKGLAHASRLRVLREILDQPGIGLAEISEATGLHENTLRDHLRILRDSGFVRAEDEHRPTRGRPRRVFHPVRGEASTPESRQRIDDAKRNGDLLRKINAVSRPEELDDDAVHQLDALYEHLDDLGLDPAVAADARSVELAPCPFLALVEDDPGTACHVHAELIKSVLDQAGGPVRLTELVAYSTPHTCHAHLGFDPDVSDRAS